MINVPSVCSSLVFTHLPINSTKAWENVLQPQTPLWRKKPRYVINFTSNIKYQDQIP